MAVRLQHGRSHTHRGNAWGCSEVSDPASGCTWLTQPCRMSNVTWLDPLAASRPRSLPVFAVRASSPGGKSAGPEATAIAACV
jgi:hypothetical protein